MRNVSDDNLRRRLCEQFSNDDGFRGLVTGLEDVPNLLAELMRRGWTATEIKKLAGRNVLRVMRDAERMAKQLQREPPGK